MRTVRIFHPHRLQQRIGNEIEDIHTHETLQEMEGINVPEKSLLRPLGEKLRSRIVQGSEILLVDLLNEITVIDNLPGKDY